MCLNFYVWIRQQEGITAASCIELVMSSDPCLFDYTRAAKFYRERGELQKSYEALKKALEIKPYPKAHHQIALTLNKLARQSIREKEREQAEETRGSTVQPLF